MILPGRRAHVPLQSRGRRGAWVVRDGRRRHRARATSQLYRPAGSNAGDRRGRCRSSSDRRRASQSVRRLHCGSPSGLPDRPFHRVTSSAVVRVKSRGRRRAPRQDVSRESQGELGALGRFHACCRRTRNIRQRKRKTGHTAAPTFPRGDRAGSTSHGVNATVKNKRTRSVRVWTHLSRATTFPLEARGPVPLAPALLASKPCSPASTATPAAPWGLPLIFSPTRSRTSVVAAAVLPSALAGAVSPPTSSSAADRSAVSYQRRVHDHLTSRELGAEKVQG